MTLPFVHLHVHSEYSLLDGACHIDKLPKVAKELGQPAIALTDHGNLYGAVDFYREAKSVGVKPIIGYEAYVAPGRRQVKEASQGVKDAGHHLVLLAKNETGYRNLLKLGTTAYLDGFYYRPRIDKEILAELREGLIVMTSCLAGEVPSLLNGGHYEEAVRVATFYRDLVGAENFFIELQNHGIDDELRVMPLLVDVAKEIGVGLVATNDVHYLRADDSKAHDALLCISTGKLLTDEHRMRYPAGEFHIKTAEEMAARFSQYPEALANTVKIADLCHLELDFSKRHAPIYTPPAGSTDVEYLRKVCDDGLKWRYGEVTDELRERLARELKVIEGKSFASYFLIVWDFVDFARRNNIPCGARGSGVGALVSYVLGLSDVDPLRYGLLFERFMDPSRSEMPDIDMDICQDGRARIIQYVRDKYGHENVAQIITFGTMAARAVVRDVGRVMGFAVSDIDAIAKKIPAELNMTLDKALEVEPELQKMYEDDERVHELIDIARRLEGTSRHASVHAAGVVMADAPLVNYVPLCLAGEDVTTQWTMGAVEKVGLLKMDFLGLRTLTILQRAVDLVRADHGVEVKLAALEPNDPKVFALFGRGETKGIFQFESSGMRDLLQKMKPDRFEDLIAANALYRPGPMEMIDPYIERKHGRQKYVPPHQVLADVLDETYGIMAYQEQVMQILNRLGDLDLPRAYKLIKAISKKSHDTIAAEEKAFVAGAQKKNLSQATIDEIWNFITKFGGYGFNKSHSTRYAQIAYQTAWMKAHYPVEFMAALLTFEMINTDSVVEYIGESKRMGIDVRPPDVNESASDFTVVGGAIRFGLAAVKGVGERAVQAVIEARQGSGPFTSLFDFCERVDLHLMNRGVVESLVKCGAFDFIGARRSQLMAVLERALAQGGRAQADKRSGQADLFGGSGGGASEHDKRALPNIPEFAPTEKLKLEKEVLGFYVSDSPLTQHEAALRRYCTATISDLATRADSSLVIIGGLVTSRRDRLTKSGRSPGSKMAIIELQDFTGKVECVAFPETLKECEALLKEDQVLFVAGEVSRKWEQPSLRISKLLTVEEAMRDLTGGVHVRLREQALETETLEGLQKILAAHPGKVPVYVELTTPQNYRVIVRAGDKFRVATDEALVSELDGFLGEGHLAMVGVGLSGLNLPRRNPYRNGGGGGNGGSGHGGSGGNGRGSYGKLK